MKKKTALVFCIVFAVLLLVLLGVIYYFSSENAVESTDTSNGVTEVVLKILHPEFDTLSYSERQALFEKSSYVVRKLAHFTEYFLLGLFSSLLLFFIGQATQKNILPFFIVTFIFGVVCSVLDEGHQYFVEGRSAQFTDVLIDSAGNLLATLIVFSSYLFAKKLSSKK